MTGTMTMNRYQAVFKNLNLQLQSIKKEYEKLYNFSSSYSAFQLNVCQSLKHVHEVALKQQEKSLAQKNDILILSKLSETNKAQAIECQKEIESFLSSSQFAEEQF